MPDGLLIVRFGPWSADGCRKTAWAQYDDDIAAGRQPPRYGISVSADMVQEGESVDDVVARICRLVPLNGKKVAAVMADELERQGWEIHPDTPPDMHYLVGQQGLQIVPDVGSLELLWNAHKRDNPMWGREGR